MRLVKDRVVEHPHRYKLTKVAGSEDVYDLEQVPGTVTDAGTAVNRQLFNSIDSALLCTHSKTGTVHTFTLNADVAAFVPGQTIYTVKAALTASIEVGDTFTLTDGTTSYTGIVPKTSEGGNYRVTLFQNLSPVVIFEVNLGGSAKHAFFRGGGNKRLYREVFTVSGIWTCPDFVDEVYVLAFGGGGGGGAGVIPSSESYYYRYGGGGGGGYMAQAKISVTPSKKYSITIGKGGLHGDSKKNINGGDGGRTSFGNLLYANGGKGGKGNDESTAHGEGGAGGAGGGGGWVSKRTLQSLQPIIPGESSQFKKAENNDDGGDGYGVFSRGGRCTNIAVYNRGKVEFYYGGGGGGGGSYGRGGDGSTVSTAVGDLNKQSDWPSKIPFASKGEFGGGGGGGIELPLNQGYDGSAKDGGDGILFISYYADPSMMVGRHPEEFDVQTNGTEVFIP